ncbi:FkbM family methyltransferase [Hydrogenophaga sp. 5NK40-0174]|uniref:FkbM family methyltransferase n=1 Tax=Hydrogenophaga sp. 5NK40-0174 TaxID=3127649 RepID=UPI0031045C94
MDELMGLLAQLGHKEQSMDWQEHGRAQVLRSSSLCVIRNHDESQAELKQSFEDLCNIDINGEHFWIGVDSTERLYEPHPSPVVVSYYTTGTPYEACAKELIASIEALGAEQPYCVVGIESAGTWEANCSLKPSFILNCLKELQRPVLWVDADAKLQRPPHIPAGFDFAVHRYDGWEFASGTVYFAYNERAIGLLERWIELCQMRPMVWDQMLLDQAWAEYSQTHDLVTGWLPERYTHVFDTQVMSREQQAPVITHYQASRAVPNKRPKPDIPKTVVDLRRLACAQPFQYDVASESAQADGEASTRSWPSIQTDLGGLMDYVHALRDGQDQSVQFLQVGAMDGVKFDPLYKRIRAQQWHGALFEPLTDMYERLVANYDDCEGLVFVNAAIDACDGERVMYRIPAQVVEDGTLPDWALGISSFYTDRNAIGGKKVDEATHDVLKSVRVEETVLCKSFQTALDELGFASLDLLQIDTEGHDWAILQTFPLDRIKPLVINFEYYNLGPGELSQALSWLERHGYAYGMDHKDVTATLLRLG